MSQRRARARESGRLHLRRLRVARTLLWALAALMFTVVAVSDFDPGPTIVAISLGLAALMAGAGLMFAPDHWRLPTAALVRAEVLAVRDTGQRVVNPVLELQLRITFGDRPPYDVLVHKDGIPPLELPKLVAGRVLAVRALPNVNDVLIEWNEEPPPMPWSYRR